MTDKMARGKLTVSDEQIIAFVDDEEAPFVFPIEVADRFNLTYQWAHKRLTALVEGGELRRKEAGPQSIIYYLPQD